MKDPSDVFNELSGSTGMLGAQDCAWLISKKDRSDNEATLHITGRDLDNRDLKIEFDKKFFQWRYIGTEEEVEARRRETAYMQSPIRETIIKLVGQGSGHWEGRSEEIKNASKYLSQEIYEDVRNIGKFIREYSDLLQGIDGVNAIPGNTKTRKWKFNDTSDIMSYEVINEELKIAKCSITDLTIGQVHNFLESWGDDSKIGTLTMFYDREKELLVLNEDNDMYETCLMTATAYLSGDYERRKELLKNAPEGIVESVKLLEKVFKYRLFDKRTFQALNNLLDDTQRKYVAHLINEEDPISAVYIAFRAGMISGKRIERAKKRKDR